MGRMPTAFAHALCVLDLHLAAPREFALVGPRDSALARQALAGFDPNAVVAFTAGLGGAAGPGGPPPARKDPLAGAPPPPPFERVALPAPLAAPLTTKNRSPRRAPCGAPAH